MAQNNGCKKMHVFDLLNLRFQWEEIVRDYKMDDKRKVGLIDNLQWYIDNGATGNRFRSGYKESCEIAKEILDNF